MLKIIIFFYNNVIPQALVSFKKYIPRTRSLPFFKVNICPLLLPHFIENETFAEYSCPIRLRGARYLYLNVAVEKKNISGV
jgi:hypothetical protein